MTDDATPAKVRLTDGLGADSEAREIARVEGFECGDTQCLRCGTTLHLYFNGGELDSVECCGLTYKTEAVRIDLVVYEGST